MFYKAIAHPRYFLGGHRPSETSILTNLSSYISFTLLSAKDLSIHGQRSYSTLVHKNAKAI
jgi:hypothetical protein